MGLIAEKEIRGLQLKDVGLVCPVCATDEERETAEPENVISEDKIHDNKPMFCVRCKKKIA